MQILRQSRRALHLQRHLLRFDFHKGHGFRYASLLRQEAYVGGKWVPALSGKTFAVTNPANGKVIGHVPDMDDADTQAAIDSAYEAFQSWQRTTAKERSILLRKWYNLMEESKEDLALILTAEAGKPLAESRGEIGYGSSFIEWFAEEARRINGEVVPSPASSKEMIFIREPIGVVSLITPLCDTQTVNVEKQRWYAPENLVFSASKSELFRILLTPQVCGEEGGHLYEHQWNFPNAMITRKAGAALASGCTCVIKPAEDTPLSALAIADLAEQAGLPPGVVNVVTSSRPNTPAVGNLLCTSPKIAGVSFTGSSAVGKLLYRLCSSGIKKIGLELGGNAPFIVFDSADLNKAVEGFMVAKFRNAGQTCISANRIFVQSGIYDKFVAACKEVMSKRLVIGDGFSKDVNVGPLINQSQIDKVEGMVNDSVTLGAEVLMGAKRHELGGLFYEPTILTNVSSEMPCVKEEIFGPVAAIQKFESEDEVLAKANACQHGLAGYFFSQDYSQVWRVARRLEVGMIGINDGLISAAEAAFGGIKESGIGREGSSHGVDDYTHIKYLCMGGIN